MSINDLMDFEEEIGNDQSEPEVLDPGRLDPQNTNKMREEELRLSGMEHYKVRLTHITHH